MIPLPKFCSLPQLTLLLASILQVVALMATFAANVADKGQRQTYILFDFVTITFTMLILLFVARKTAKDLLLHKKSAHGSSSLASLHSRRAAGKTNEYEEIVFQGSDEAGSIGDQLALITNNKRAEDYTEYLSTNTHVVPTLISARASGKISSHQSLNSDDFQQQRNLST